jgi:hypothetical protein
MPKPDAAPVTTTRRPDRSMPAATSAAVLEKPKGVVMALTDGLLVDWQRLWMTQISWAGRVMRSICPA